MKRSNNPIKPHVDNDEQVIPGTKIILKPASVDDRRMIFEWLACSDLAQFMWGAPIYPEYPIQTWDEFLDDYTPNYFDNSAPQQGRCFLILAGGKAVGQVNYNQILGPKDDLRTELDIWLRSEADCGRGYGSDALVTLCKYLNQKFGVLEFLVRPSVRNPRAIHTYKKAGFVIQDRPREKIEARWGEGEYADGVSLIMTIPLDLCLD